jgi:hypothetical protein
MLRVQVRQVTITSHFKLSDGFGPIGSATISLQTDSAVVAIRSSALPPLPRSELILDIGVRVWCVVEQRYADGKYASSNNDSPFIPRARKSCSISDSTSGSSIVGGIDMAFPSTI